MEPNEQIITPEKPKESKLRLFLESVQFLLIAFILVFGLRTFIAQPFIVSGASMVPTFQDKQYLIIDELTYRFREPARGEVIVFRYPRDPSKFFIKRIVALPNETIIINDGKVMIKSKENEDILFTEPYIEGETIKNMSRVLGESEYFVLGDNREESSDSRIWGPVEKNLIVGRAFVRLLPVAEASFLPGDFSELFEEKQNQ